MKNVSQVITSLTQKPRFAKLLRSRCVDRIKSLFPPHLQRLVRYGYIHSGTLYFVLAHPGAKQEFDNIIASIKEPLREFMPQECQSQTITEIKAFVRYEAQQSQKSAYKSVVEFQESSNASFINRANNPDLHALFESIRGHIDAKSD